MSLANQTAINQIVTAGAEGCLVRDEEIDHLRHFLRRTRPAAGEEGILLFPILLDGLVVSFRKSIEQVVHSRCVDSSGTHGIHPDVILPQVDGQTAGYLTYRTFGHSIDKTVRLPDKKLV